MLNIYSKTFILLFFFLSFLNASNTESNQINKEKFELKTEFTKKNNDIRNLEKRLNNLEKIILDKNKIEISFYQMFTLVVSFFALIISWRVFSLNKEKEKLNLEINLFSEHKTGVITHLSPKNFIVEKSTGYFAIEIVNKSYFNINIKSISFFSKKYEGQQLIPNNGFFDLKKTNINFPFKIEEKNSFTIYFRVNDLQEFNIESLLLKLSTGEREVVSIIGISL